MGDANRFAEPLDQGSVLGTVESVEHAGKRSQFVGRTQGKKARRRAYRMLWRFMTGILPGKFVKRAIGR
jgi:hypothetical protein